MPSPNEHGPLLNLINGPSGRNRSLQGSSQERQCKANGHFFDPCILETVSTHLSQQYRCAAPFPHIELKNFACQGCLQRVARIFPGNNDLRWFHYPNNAYQSDKRVIWNLNLMPESIVGLIKVLHSKMFVTFLQTLTGIRNLIADPSLYGGGLHQTGDGGRLELHVDHDFNPNLNLYRRVTVLVYLSNWRADYGGNLELWRGYREGRRDVVVERAKTIVPTFNTVVVFTNSESSYHGYPQVIRCPMSRYRNTIATFYASPDPHPSYSRTQHHKSRFVVPIRRSLSDHRTTNRS